MWSGSRLEIIRSLKYLYRLRGINLASRVILVRRASRALKLSKVRSDPQHVQMNPRGYLNAAQKVSAERDITSIPSLCCKDITFSNRRAYFQLSTSLQPKFRKMAHSWITALLLAALVFALGGSPSMQTLPVDVKSTSVLLVSNIYFWHQRWHIPIKCMPPRLPVLLWLNCRINAGSGCCR